MRSILVVFVLLSCAESPGQRARGGVAAPQQNATSRLGVPSGENPVSSAERVALRDIIARPESHLDRLVRVQGWAGVCPDLCEGIKYRCDGAAPAQSPCTGYVALSFEKTAEARCVAAASTAQNALAIDTADKRLVCSGHCSHWECPGIELGQQLEAIGKVHQFSDAQGQSHYALTADSLSKLGEGDASAGQTF